MHPLVPNRCFIYSKINLMTLSSTWIPYSHDYDSIVTSSDSVSVSCYRIKESESANTTTITTVDCELGSFDLTKCTECGLVIEQDVTTSAIGNGQCTPGTHTCAAGEGLCPAGGCPEIFDGN
eukprot:UN04018